MTALFRVIVIAGLDEIKNQEMVDAIIRFVEGSKAKVRIDKREKERLHN